ncbi:hypothetical protein VMT65_13965 [Nocardia sp. CDC153]|uniref:hypothetical protein n=1 Tax=Nocardia sp. CDC153 TaxID=3112167 RepID=UPI002DBF229A|nr:hypothetical protein [Nocardia sp. CDC153]MEC3954140.1 hypothetical protein [Nocardia sp. CDC153]
MNEDDSARREFVFGLFLITVITPLIAGLTAFAAALGTFFASRGLDRILTRRRAKPTAGAGRPSVPRMSTHRTYRRADTRHARRALSTRRPGGVLH